MKSQKYSSYRKFLRQFRRTTGLDFFVKEVSFHTIQESSLAPLRTKNTFEGNSTGIANHFIFLNQLKIKANYIQIGVSSDRD